MVPRTARAVIVSIAVCALGGALGVTQDEETAAPTRAAGAAIVNGTVTLRSGASYTGEIVIAEFGTAPDCAVGSTVATPPGGGIEVLADEADREGTVIPAADIADVELMWDRVPTGDAERWQIIALRVTQRNGDVVEGIPDAAFHLSNIKIVTGEGETVRKQTFPLGAQDLFDPSELLARISITSVTMTGEEGAETEAEGAEAGVAAEGAPTGAEAAGVGAEAAGPEAEGAGAAEAEGPEAQGAAAGAPEAEGPAPEGAEAEAGAAAPEGAEAEAPETEAAEAGAAEEGPAVVEVEGPVIIGPLQTTFVVTCPHCGEKITVQVTVSTRQGE